MHKLWRKSKAGLITALAGAGIAILLALYFLGVFSPGVYYSDRVVLLLYHHLDSRESASTISPARFRGHLDMLAEKGYHVVSLEEVVGFLLGERDIPPNAVAITFDDGYMSFFDYAYPELSKRGYPAAMFLIVGRVGRHEGEITKLGWTEIAKMQPDGFSFYAHSYDAHQYIVVNSEGGEKPALVGQKWLPEEGRKETMDDYRRRIGSDLFQAAAELKERLGPASLLYFAPPFGWSNEEVVAVGREAGFRYFVTVKPEPVIRGSDPFRLGRLNAGGPEVTAASLDRAIRQTARGKFSVPQEEY